MNVTPQDVWYYSREGERFGPVTFADLQTKVTQSSLNPRLDMVWRQGMNEWQPAGEIANLFRKRTAPDSEIAGSPQPPAGPFPDIPTYPAMTSSPRMAATVSLPLALLGAAIGWALFWLLYDFLGSFVANSTIRMPWLVLVFVFGGSGWLLGKPLGAWLRKSGFKERPHVRLMCLILVLAAAGIGEFIYIGSLLSLADQPARLPDIVATLIRPFLGDDLMEILAVIGQLLTRLLLAIGAVFGTMSAVFRAEIDDTPEQETAVTP